MASSIDGDGKQKKGRRTTDATVWNEASDGTFQNQRLGGRTGLFIHALASKSFCLIFIVIRALTHKSDDEMHREFERAGSNYQNSLQDDIHLLLTKLENVQSKALN